MRTNSLVKFSSWSVWCPVKVACVQQPPPVTSYVKVALVLFIFCFVLGLGWFTVSEGPSSNFRLEAFSKQWSSQMSLISMVHCLVTLPYIAENSSNNPQTEHWSPILCITLEQALSHPHEMIQMYRLNNLINEIRQQRMVYLHISIISVVLKLGYHLGIMAFYLCPKAEVSLMSLKWNQFRVDLITFASSSMTPVMLQNVFFVFIQGIHMHSVP